MNEELHNTEDTMDELKKNVEQMAREEGKTELEIISDLQAACATTGDDRILDDLCELKWEYI